MNYETAVSRFLAASTVDSKNKDSVYRKTDIMMRGNLKSNYEVHNVIQSLEQISPQFCYCTCGCLCSLLFRFRSLGSIRLQLISEI